MSKPREGGNSDSTANARKTKKIQLEIYEDHEASFYLALALLKVSQKIDADQVKLLLDSIHYAASDVNRTAKFQDDFKTVWNYLKQAAKHSEDYEKVAGLSFEVFLISEFGQSIENVLQHFSVLKDVVLHGESVEAKTRAALLSRFFEALKDPIKEKSRTEMNFKYKEGALQKGKIEQTSIGVFKVSQEHSNDGVETEFYVQRDGSIKKVLSFDDFQREDFEAVYTKTRDTLLKIRQDDNFLYYSTLSGATIDGETIDLSKAIETNVEQRPIPPMSMLENPIVSGNEAQIAMPSIDVESSVSVEHEISLTNRPTGIIKELENIYHIPDNARKDFYLRQKAMTSIFDEVDKYFPDLTAYTKSIVTGYLCIPLDIVDSEEIHNQSERTQTYHEYLGKTVRNTLKSKPFTF